MTVFQPAALAAWLCFFEKHASMDSFELLPMLFARKTHVMGASVPFVSPCNTTGWNGCWRTQFSIVR